MEQPHKQLHWIALTGLAEIDDLAIRYKPHVNLDGPPGSPGQPSWTILRSNQYFQGGVIEFEVLLSGPDCKCQIVLNSGGEAEVYVGFHFGGAAYGIAIYRNLKWEPVSSTTAMSGNVPPPQNVWTKARIVVVGSNVTLFVNDVNVATRPAIIQKAQLGLYLSGSAEIQVRNIVVQAQTPKAFIVMQFTDEFNALYSEVIRPTCEAFGYECVRADNIYSNGQIIEDIARSIDDAAVIIADITPNNPNVYYEVGYAHGIRKPTILLSDKAREKLPFDIAGFRTLFYENTIGGKSLIEESLTKHLESLRN